MVVGAYENTYEVDSCTKIEVSEVCLVDRESQYADSIFCLKNGYVPIELDLKNKSTLRLKVNQYQLVNDVLLKKNYDYVLLRCLEKP